MYNEIFLSSYRWFLTETFGWVHPPEWYHRVPPVRLKTAVEASAPMRPVVFTLIAVFDLCFR